MVNISNTSINSADPKVAVESEGRALRRKHIADAAVAAKPGDVAGLELGDKVRDAIKRSTD